MLFLVSGLFFFLFFTNGHALIEYPLTTENDIFCPSSSENHDNSSICNLVCGESIGCAGKSIYCEGISCHVTCIAPEACVGTSIYIQNASLLNLTGFFDTSHVIATRLDSVEIHCDPFCKSVNLSLFQVDDIEIDCNAKENDHWESDFVCRDLWVSIHDAVDLDIQCNDNLNTGNGNIDTCVDIQIDSFGIDSISFECGSFSSNNDSHAMCRENTWNVNGPSDSFKFICHGSGYTCMDAQIQMNVYGDPPPQFYLECTGTETGMGICNGMSLDFSGFENGSIWLNFTDNAFINGFTEIHDSFVNRFGLFVGGLARTIDSKWVWENGQFIFNEFYLNGDSNSDSVWIFNEKIMGMGGQMRFDLNSFKCPSSAANGDCAMRVESDKDLQINQSHPTLFEFECPPAAASNSNSSDNPCSFQCISSINECNVHVLANQSRYVSASISGGGSINVSMDASLLNFNESFLEIKMIDHGNASDDWIMGNHKWTYLDASGVSRVDISLVNVHGISMNAIDSQINVNCQKCHHFEMRGDDSTEINLECIGGSPNGYGCLNGSIYCPKNDQCQINCKCAQNESELACKSMDLYTIGARYGWHEINLSVNAPECIDNVNVFCGDSRAYSDKCHCQASPDGRTCHGRCGDDSCLRHTHSNPIFLWIAGAIGVLILIAFCGCIYRYWKQCDRLKSTQIESSLIIDDGESVISDASDWLNAEKRPTVDLDGPFFKSPSVQ